MNNFIEVKECRICGSDRLESFLSLGPMPLANNFLTKEQLNQSEPLYPLDVRLCLDCSLVQLGQVVSPETMFCDYAYLTGTSSPMRAHFMGLAQDVVKHFKPKSSYFVVDIGSNDGTLLECFKTLGVEVLGIEPAKNVAKLAQDRGINTICDWFTSFLAERIQSERTIPDAILATNVFAHVHDLRSFVKAVKKLMGKDTLFILEVPYLVDMLAKTEFDTIYHEHLSYFSVYSLARLFNIFNMAVIDVERIGVHGGSLRVYVKRGKTSWSAPNVPNLIEMEVSQKLYMPNPYVAFARRVEGIRQYLLPLLNSLSSVSGYGAPAKSTTLLNSCQIINGTLAYITDTTSTKQGRFTPGTHIPIYPEDHFHKYPPDYALLLAWNYADAILKKEQEFLKAGGRFIIPIPNPRILE